MNVSRFVCGARLAAATVAFGAASAGCYLTLDNEALDAKGAGAQTATAAEEPADGGAPEFTTSLDTPAIELDFEGERTTRDPCVATTEQARDILTKNCSECHAPPGNAAGFSTILDFPALVNARSATVTDPVTSQPVRLVVPGKPEQSRLYLRVRGNEMPPRRDPALPQLPRPTTSAVSVLRTWIQSCLVNYPSTPAAPPAAPPSQ